MSDWQRHLDLKDAWRQFDEGQLTVRQLAAVVADRLEALEPFGIDDLDYAREEVADEFRGLAEDASADVEDFDDALSRLYDWGDTHIEGGKDIGVLADTLNLSSRIIGGKKACWVATRF